MSVRPCHGILKVQTIEIDLSDCEPCAALRNHFYDGIYCILLAALLKTITEYDAISGLYFKTALKNGSARPPYNWVPSFVTFFLFFCFFWRSLLIWE